MYATVRSLAQTHSLTYSLSNVPSLSCECECECAQCVKELYEPDLQSSLSGVGYKSVEGVATKDDWLVLLMGGREHKYNKGDVVLAKGQQREAIFQISSGSCRIEVDGPDGSKTVVGKMNMDEVQKQQAR